MTCDQESDSPNNTLLQHAGNGGQPQCYSDLHRGRVGDGAPAERHQNVVEGEIEIEQYDNNPMPAEKDR